MNKSLKRPRFWIVSCLLFTVFSAVACITTGGPDPEGIPVIVWFEYIHKDSLLQDTITLVLSDEVLYRGSRVDASGYKYTTGNFEAPFVVRSVLGDNSYSLLWEIDTLPKGKIDTNNFRSLEIMRDKDGAKRTIRFSSSVSELEPIVARLDSCVSEYRK